MFREICGILVFTFLIHGGQSDLPPGVVKCILDDGVCLKREFQSIIDVLRKDPSIFNVENVQPIIRDDLFILPGDFLNFQHEYKNIKLYNHNFNKILNVSIVNSIETQVFEIYFENPEFLFVADYEFKHASVQNVPISSKGKVLYREQLVQGYVRMATSLLEVNHDNKKHLVITDLTLSYNPVRVIYDFATENGKADHMITNIINSHWGLVFSDVGDSYEMLYAAAYREILQSVFDKFSCDDLFLDFIPNNLLSLPRKP